MTFSGPNPSIWVGGLDLSLNEQKLYDYFVRIGPVASVRVCVDSATQKSLGYGYVNFQDPADAEKALDLVGSKLGNRYLRIAKIQRDPAKRRSGVSNIVVKKLPATIDTYALKEMFAKFGRLTSIVLAYDEKGASRGYARISYEREESAVEAVKEMNGTEVDGQPILVERYQPQHHEEMLKQFANLYVKNLNPAVTDEQLRDFFSTYGTVTSAKVRDLGEIKTEVGFGYVAFVSHDDAVKAVEALNGKECEIAQKGMALDVSRFRSREERLRDLERQRHERAKQYMNYPNLYVKGFDETVTSERLKELFETYGETISVRVMVDPETGLSHCFGFVSMKDHAAAAQAIQMLNGSTFLSSRPLFVTYALRKDIRRQNLEERSKQQFRIRQNHMGGAGASGGMGGPPSIGFMSGPKIFGNMGMPFMNPRMPMMPMAAAAGGFGMGRPMGGGPAPMNQMRVARPMGAQKPPMHTMVPQHYPQQAPPSQSLSAMLPNLTPDQQRNVLGERLYSYIVRSHPTLAAKVTGMLLEMETTEIVNMLENPALLDSKISEALDVLNHHMGV
ncbi:unnamed protein product [Phytomonas sp. EM1]|nr:unnamed protein product [Phytomonas sp. EM1]|eukprot:CCW61390.1 unnamed protein product [Phytomonas sp. isolate EM1]